MGEWQLVRLKRDKSRGNLAWPCAGRRVSTAKTDLALPQVQVNRFALAVPFCPGKG